MGPHVVRNLVSQNHDVFVFHRGQTKTALPDSVEHITGDRDNAPALKSAIQHVRPDVVVDMIPLYERQANELVHIAAGVAKRLVVISSCDVYRNYDLLRGVETGDPDPARLSEDSPLREKLYTYRAEVPDDKHRFYAYEKILVERSVLSRTDLPATVLRLPFVYGPDDYQHRFYGYIKRMIDNRPAILLAEEQAASLMTRGYCENCADAIALAACDDRASERIYNVGEADTLPEHEWVRKIAEVIGWPGKIVRMENSRLPNHLQADLDWRHHLDIDTSRIRTEIGYREKIDRTAALRRTVDWERANSPKEMAAETFDYDAEDEVLAGMDL